MIPEALQSLSRFCFVFANMNLLYRTIIRFIVTFHDLFIHDLY